MPGLRDHVQDGGDARRQHDPRVQPSLHIGPLRHQDRQVGDGVMSDGMAPHSWEVKNSYPMWCAFRCSYCRAEITLRRPVDNHRPSDGELSSHGVTRYCEIATVAEVMES